MLAVQFTWNPHSSEEAHKKSPAKLDLAQVFKAHQLFSQTEVVDQSETLLSKYLSDSYDANIFLKRENNQRGRTYKIRGAYFLHLLATPEGRERGFLVASDGNFGVSCGIIAGLFHSMPSPTQLALSSSSPRLAFSTNSRTSSSREVSGWRSFRKAQATKSV